tara:strand:- start:16349 stop:17812 length:1464 start_codon:yes stop_codon:yes gene_type:complete
MANEVQINNIDLPHNLEAEEAVLGSIIIDSDSLTKIMGELKVEHFFLYTNGFVYSACLSLFERQEAINQITLIHELETQEILSRNSAEKSNQLEAVGGAEYISELIANTPTSVHIEHYSNLIIRTSTMRDLIKTGEEISQIGFKDDFDVDKSLSTAEDALYKIRQESISRDFVPLSRSLTNYLEQTSSTENLDDDIDRLPITTGFTRLNDLLVGGLQRSDMVVLAARPSVGKSMLGLNLAVSAAKADFKVGIFSLEMGREQIAQRLLASQSKVNMQKIRNFSLQNTIEQQQVVDSIGLLSDLSISVDDTPFQTVMEMRGKARRLQISNGLDFLIIDYMQLINGNNRGREGNRAQEVSEISRQIKSLARDLNIPILAISQLSRAIEQRTSKRPMLSDLRESGSIEQDADIVMFIHREDKLISLEEWNKANPTSPYPRNRASVIIAKHRNGPTDEVEFQVEDSIGAFQEISMINTTANYNEQRAEQSIE